MLGRREHCLAASAPYRSRDFLTVRGHDARVRDAHRGDAFQDSEDQGLPGEQAEGLAGEARRAQSGWDDGERPHGRLWAVRSAARFIPRNLSLEKRKRKPAMDQRLAAVARCGGESRRYLLRA
jgi:hypothetical protein